MYFGLSTKDVRKLAYEFALKLNLKIPTNWTKNELAGADWFSNFLIRNNTYIYIYDNQRQLVYQER